MCISIRKLIRSLVLLYSLIGCNHYHKNDNDCSISTKGNLKSNTSNYSFDIDNLKLQNKIDLSVAEIKASLDNYNLISIEQRAFLSFDTKILSVNLLNHEILWKSKANFGIKSPILYYKSNLYYVDKKGRLTNLNCKTGDVNWRCENKIDSYEKLIGANICIENDFVYHTNTYKNFTVLYRVSAIEGKVENEGSYEKRFIGKQVGENLFLTNNYIYLDDCSDLLVIDKNNGSIKFECKDKNYSLPSINSRIDNRIISSFYKYKLHKFKYIFIEKKLFRVMPHYITAYNCENNEFVWVNENYKAEAVACSKNILFLSDSNQIFALSLKTGNQLWKYRFDSEVKNLIISNKSLLVLTKNLQLYNFR
jgi:outer membrane protein assembly factor BamB